MRSTMRVLGLLFLVLAGTEAGLRLAGRLFYFLSPPDAPPVAGKSVILCVGESTTYGLWTNPGDPYPQQLEQMLTAYLGEAKYQVLINPRGTGKNTAILLEGLPQILRQYRPAIVIYMVGANNVWTLQHTHIALWADDDRVGHLVLNLVSMLDNFRVFKLLRLAKESLFPAGYVSGFPPTVEAREFAARHEELFHDILMHDLREMVRLARATGAVPLLMTYPLGNVRREHLEVAKELGVPLIDNQPTFDQLKASGVLKDYLFAADNWHPNKAGYTIIAKNVLDALIANGIVGKTQ